MSTARQILVALVVPLLLVSVGPASAQTRDPKSGLREIQRDIEAQRAAQESAHREAGALAAEIAETRERLAVVGRAVRDLETEAMRLERRITEIEKTEGERVRTLELQRDKAATMVGAMVRLARFPPEAVIAQPVPPADVVRAAIAVRAAVPLVQEAAGTLRSEVADLGATRADLKERRKNLGLKLARLERDRKELDGLLAKRRDLLRQTATREKSAETRLEELSQRAQDLQDLVERLERERRERAARDAAAAKARAEAEAKARAEAQRQAQEAAAQRQAQEAEAQRQAEDAARKREETLRREVRSVERAKGRLLFPVAGRVIGLYGQATGAGLTRKGVDIEARVEAQVVAPFDGEVVFAGPFRGYGRILIIDHGEGYHSLLAGLDRIEGSPGQHVLAGEPVGRMGRLGAGPPILYLEFRRDGQPINPLPWLARSGDGVSG